jgi:hypothetical protein
MRSLLFTSTLQRSTEKGKSGPRINGDLLCSVQSAECSVQRAECRRVCVHDRHRHLHDCALTSCNRMASTSLQQDPPDPSRASLTSRL